MKKANATENLHLRRAATYTTNKPKSIMTKLVHQG